MGGDRDGPKIIFQVLVDPELDMALIFPSVQEFGHGCCPALRGASAWRRKAFNDHYFGVSRNVEDRGAIAGVWRRSVQADGIGWLYLLFVETQL